MNGNILNILRILFFILFYGISLACYSDNSIVVGLFRLTPCPDRPSSYSISMNKDAVLDNSYETLRIPSKIQDKGKTYQIDKITAKGFMNCCFIKKLVIDEGIKAIGKFAFYGCSNLHSVCFPSTMSSLAECIFYNCPELKSIDVNKANPVFDSREQCNAVIRTSDGAIELGCAGTTFPQSISHISRGAFRGCTGLVSLNIPQSIKVIEEYAFSDCFQLKKIVLPDDCTLDLGQSVFDGCCSLTSFHLPDAEIYFCQNPFTNCENLSSFTVSPSNKDWYTNKENNALICDSVLFAGCYNTTIDSSIKRIYASAFKGCRRLTKVFIPEGVKTIDADSFSGCVNLVNIVVDKDNKVYDSREGCNCIIETQSNKIVCGSSVAVIPKSVSTIGKYAFCGMNTPAVFSIPDNISKMEESAFMYCNSLYQLVVPANTELKRNSFFRCVSLTSVIYEPNNIFVKSKKDLTFDNSPYLSCPNLMSISISEENIPVIEHGYFVNSKKNIKPNI